MLVTLGVLQRTSVAICLRRESREERMGGWEKRKKEVVPDVGEKIKGEGHFCLAENMLARIQTPLDQFLAS
jgi:hypothetical protein